MQEDFMDSVNQDQTAQNVQSDLDLHCPHFYSMIIIKLFLDLAMEVYL